VETWDNYNDANELCEKGDLQEIFPERSSFMENQRIRMK
jgi:hypothetical protein